METGVNTAWDLITVLAFMSLTTPKYAAETIASGDNEHLFLDLCTLITLPQRKLPTLTKATEVLTDYKEIKKLNTSLTSNDWRKQFSKIGDPPQLPSYQDKDGKTNELWKQRWVDWTRAEGDIDQKDTAAETLQKVGADKLAPAERMQLHAMLQALAESAAALANYLGEVAAEATELDEANIKEQLQLPVFGKGAKTVDELTEDRIKTANGNHSDRNKLCGSDTDGTAKAQTLSALLYCICAGDSSDDSGRLKACTNEQTESQNANTGTKNIHTDTKMLISKFPHPHAKELTVDELQTVVTTFLTTKKSKARKTFFGSFTTTDCGGKSGSGLCEHYKTSKKRNSATIKHIRWVKALLDVARKLRQQKSTADHITNLAKQLANLKQKPFNLKPQLELYNHLKQAMRQLAPPPEANTQAQWQQKKEQCEAIKKATQCREKQPTC
uniref:Variant surface glycoprotein 1282 n=1 Tax=Trypanosoma brucei TaxID=5691 RepID=M4SY62_9TRYP|nr:variant surface glycoprotein 1282 [Trypanosoma brucei]